MARRSASSLTAVALCLAALWALAGLSAPAFVPSAQTPNAPAARAEAALDLTVKAAVISAALMAPQAAHAANSGYALLQLGWAVFIIGLGPAVLFWIYFNKPELL
mmetsp:Transcript_49856/g.138488  ORF Transcript_49856/g.138488 Transcript_49856/m.138488 type:complete len:105 (-) Transcript_49856:7-321(-)